jgi:guanine nucleotide-binding protein G(I)/G(S)/G(T) subunit beta-1
MTCAFEREQGKFVACGGLDNLCSIYNLDGSAVMRATRELAAHDGYLSCCRFISEQEIVTSSGDSTCILWDVERGEMKQQMDDHNGDAMSVALHPTDPKCFVSGSTDATARVIRCRILESLSWRLRCC